jgi:Mrp family chromosome partitioning ATPase
VERIAKAIELAREAAESAGVEPLRLRDPARPVPAAQIRYSRTRTVAVSADALQRQHVTGGHERTPVAEAFKRLRTQIMQRMRDAGRNALGVASPRAGEGKSTVALNLAVHAAMETDWTVLLVEADVRHPALCDALGLERLPGLAEYLAEDAPLETLLVHPGFGRCILLPAGGPARGSSELLGSARMQDLATELKRRYPDRLVIYDLPPLLESADGVAVLPWTEALLLVVEEGRTPAEDVLRAAQVAGPRLVGTVLNKSRLPQAGAHGRPWWRKLFS